MATKEEVAQFIGLSERQLANIIRENPGAPVAHGKGQWDIQAMVRWYIGVLKAQQKTAAKPEEQTEEEGDPAKIFAKRKNELALKKMEEDVRAMRNKNDLTEFKNGPIDLLEWALAKLAGNLASRHDGLIPRLKIACPDLTPAMMARLEEEVIKFRNECADVTIDFAEYTPNDDEGDYESD
ncbi:hypothetical protein MM188_003209 [Vibrio cholerae]|nr:hypothetical protein [Vibrio cholerae]